MFKNLKNLAAKIIILNLFLFSSSAFAGGIPVFDGANVTQATISAFEEVTQTLKQIEQYTTQLQQLEDQIINSTAPAQFLYAQADRTMKRISDLQNNVIKLYETAGDLDRYLDKFGNLDTYKQSDYYNKNLSPEQKRAALDKMNEGGRQGLDFQDKAYRDFMKTLEAEKRNVKRDAEHLEEIQRNAQQAGGRMAAIQYTNQIAAHHSAQLMQLRGVLQSMATAQMAKEQAEKDQKAKEMSHHEWVNSGTVERTIEPDWTF